jgi:hypothetical protein
MTHPVRIVFVLPDATSNKRVRRPEPAQVLGKRPEQWPLNQPIPLREDPQVRRALSDARREIAYCRPEIERLLRSPGQ